VIFSQGLFPGNNDEQLQNSILLRANFSLEKGLYNEAGRLLSNYLENAGFKSNGRSEDLLNRCRADSRKISVACLKLGVCLMHLSESDSALRVLERGLSCLGSAGSGNEKLIDQYLFQVANCLALLGDYNGAIKSFQEVLGKFHSDNRLKGQIFENLGAIYFIREDYENALLHFQKAFMLKRSLKNNRPGQIEKLLVDIGATYCKMKDYTGALACYSNADNRTENSEKNSSLFPARLKTDLGTLYMRMNRPDLALNSFYTGLKLYGELDGESPEETILLLSDIANVHIQQGRYDSAWYYLRLPFRLFRFLI